MVSGRLCDPFSHRSDPMHLPIGFVETECIMFVLPPEVLFTGGSEHSGGASSQMVLAAGGMSSESLREPTAKLNGLTGDVHGCSLAGQFDKVSSARRNGTAWGPQMFFMTFTCRQGGRPRPGKQYVQIISSAMSSSVVEESATIRWSGADAGRRSET